MSTIGLGLALAGFTGSATAQSDTQQTPPGLEKKGGVPPGLQKKGGVPPGQAKKNKKGSADKTDEAAQEQEAASEANPAVKGKPAASSAPGDTAPSSPASSTSPSAAQAAKDPAPAQPAQPAKAPTPEKKVSREVQAERDKLHRQLADLNNLTTAPEVRQRILGHISERRRIPMATLEAQLKAHPGTGVGDLYVAHVIARKVNQPVENILSENRSGRSWGELVNTYRVKMDDLQENTETLRTMAKRTAKKTSA